VLDSADADVVNDALQRVVKRGTGVGARFGKPLAGKTGTTQNYGDAWFVGYTPGRCCATAVWMGYAAGQSIPMNKVHGRRVTGGSFPAQIFSRFMTVATKGEDVGKFATIDELDGELLGSSRRSTGSSGDTVRTATTRARSSSSDTAVPVDRPAVTAVTGGDGGAGEGAGGGTGQGSSSSDGTENGDAGDPSATAPATVPGTVPGDAQTVPTVPAVTQPVQTPATAPPQTFATVVIQTPPVVTAPAQPAPVSSVPSG
jgi:penicillin-binding protein 1A